LLCLVLVFFFSSRRRHTRFSRDWSSDVCSSDLILPESGACAWSSGDSSPHAVNAVSNAAPARTALIFFTLAFYPTADPLLHRRRSEERRVGKECRSRWPPYPEKKKQVTARSRRW